MIFNKEKSIKLSDYFELTKPVYKYIQITPHKSIRNFNSSNIAKAIANTYRSINKQIRIEKKKLFFETNFKISYVVDITKDNTSFYFIVPRPFVNIIIEKISEIWNKATVTVVEEGINPFSKDAEYLQLTYRKEDPLSLAVDKKSNEPLNSILSVVDIMKDNDRVSIIYNFLPLSQSNWIDRYELTMNKLKNKKSIEKQILSMDYILRNTVVTVLDIFNSLISVLCDFAGVENKNEQDSLFNIVNRVMQHQSELSVNTKKKKEATVLNTQIAIISESEDITRKQNNINCVCSSYRVLDEDNSLIQKSMKPIQSIEQYDFNIDRNTFSTDEVSNFIQIPGRTLLNYFNIKHIKTEEVTIPQKLQQGYILLGDSKYKGTHTKAYLDDDYNVGNLPLVLIGSQGSGKSEYIKNIAKYCVMNNESIVLLDFIKSCNLSNTIAEVVPKDKLVILDLAKETEIQGLGYNEIKIDNTLTDFKKLDYASKQAQQVMNLVDAISVGDPLSSRMRRFLSSAAKVVFVQGYSSLKDVVNCLEDYRKRYKFVNGLSENLKIQLEDEINTLEELNEYSKVTKDNPVKEIIGTYTSKIEHILDRIGMLKEDFKLKYMYNKDCKDNINLVDCMEQGKVVLIQMKEDDFNTKMIKNILVTYWVSKIWLASQLRGSLNEKPLRCNFIVDEIFQSPKSLEMMEYIIPQSRKFGLHTILSTQYINQLDKVFESLEASGSSFMLLKGANEDDFNHFKSKFEGYFEYEDLRDMPKYYSLNLIYHSGGYSSFITKLPKPLKG